uniref:Uncharacterized protein n=1 Tax=Acrobeloides nanus TaxID=290746 RepID=A0A914CRD1_9BILA
MVSNSVIECLEPLFLCFPESEEEWKEVSHCFEVRTGLLNCCGAIALERNILSPRQNEYNYGYAVHMDVEAFITFMRSLLILHFLRDENSADDFSDQDENPCHFGERIPDNPPEDDEEANELRLELIRYLTVIAPIPEQVGRHGF